MERGDAHVTRRAAPRTGRSHRWVNSLVLGKPQENWLAFAALLCGGHLLIEDQPGLGKTTLAHALAATLGPGSNACSSLPT